MNNLRYMHVSKLVLAATVFFSLTGGVAGCVPSTSKSGADAGQQGSYSSPIQPTQTMPRPAAVLSDDWSKWSREDGDWSYSVSNGKPVASFAPAGRPALFQLVCDRSNGVIYALRAGNSGGPSAMVFRTSHGSAQFDAQPAQGAAVYMTSVISARAPIFDQLAYSRGHFAIETSGLRSVKLPNWPEVARVIEDCR